MRQRNRHPDLQTGPIDSGTGAVPYRESPRNIEAEQALLGAILVNNEAQDRVSDFLDADHFYDPLHQQIYEVASTLIASGKQATPITLKTYFENAEPIDASTTAVQYLGHLAANATTIINARDYGRTVYDLAVRRQMIVVGEDLVNAAYDSPVDFPPKEQIEEAQGRLNSLVIHGANERPSMSMSVALENALDEMQAAYQRGGRLAGLSTGFPELDAVCRGLVPGNMFVLAARPSMGKTSLATNIAVSVAKEENPVAFFSLEMTAVELTLRMLAPEVGIPASDLSCGAFAERDMEKVIAAQQQIARLPITIEQTGGLTMPQLATRLRKLRRTRKADLAIIDYLQLVRGTLYRGHNRVQEIAEITANLKGLAKELNIPILLLSQLSRETERREDKRPQLADLRDSGSIEQDADLVAFVFRPVYYTERNNVPETYDPAYADWQQRVANERGKAEIIVAKMRNGATGTAHLSFDEAMMQFGSPDSGGQS